MSNITTFQLDADVSKLVASIEKAKGEFDVLQKKVDDVKGVLPNVFNTGNSDALLKSIRAQNKELDAEKQALNDLNKYLKVLEATQKQAFQSGEVSKLNAEIIKTKAAIDELTKKSGKKLDILDQLEKVPQSGSVATSAITSLGLAIASVVSLRGLSDLAQQSIRVASSFENTRVSFETMLQSGQKANELLGKLVREAAVTPFELGQLTEIGQRLLAMGIEADQLIPTIRTLGDIGAGVGQEKLPQLTIALGQVRAAGKLTGNELRQFTEAGVPLLEALAEKGGKSLKQVQSDLSAGKIGFDEVNKALASLTEQGGKFFGLMNKQSQTLTGLTSTLKDDFAQLLRSVGEGINEGLKDAVKSADGFVKSLDPEKLKGFGRAIGEIIGFLAKFIGLIVPLGAGIAAATTGVTLLTAATRLFGITLAASTGGIGLVIGGLTTLVALTAQYVLQADKLSITENKINSLREDAIAQIRDEKRQSDLLFETIRNVNTSKEQKVKAIEKLIQLYPDYLKDINSSTTLLNNLDEAQKRVNDGIIDYITNQSISKSITSEIEKQISTQIELKKAENQLATDKANSFKELTEAEVLYGTKADANVIASQKRVDVLKGQLSESKEYVKLISDSSKGIKDAIKSNLAGIDLTPEITELNQQIKQVDIELDKLYQIVPKKEQKSNAVIKGLLDQRLSYQKRLDSLINNGLKKNTNNTTITDSEVKDAEKRAKELADANKRIRDLEASFLINDAEREKTIQNNKHQDLLKQLDDYHKKRLITDETYYRVKKSAIINNELALIDIEKKYQIESSNLKAGKDKVKIAQNEIDAENEAYKKRISVIGLNQKQIEDLEVEHKAKLMTLISKFVAEVDAREEEENKKRLERLKLINELTGNERAKELLDLEENFKKSTLILGSAFDTEEGAKIYEKSLMIFTEKKQEINAKYDAIDVENATKSIKILNDNKLKIYNEQYERQLAEIDLLNAAEDDKDILRSQLSIKRKIFELDLENSLVYQKLQLGEKLTEDEKIFLTERVKNITAQIVALNSQLSKLGTNKKISVWSLIGLDESKDADKINALKDVYSQATDLANQFLNDEVQRAAKSKELADEKVATLQDQLNSEIELAKLGYANNAELRAKELEEAKAAQKKAIEEQKQAAKAQLAIQTVEQTINLVTASTKIFESLSALGPIGIGLAVATIATMFGAFAAAKTKAFAAVNAGVFEDGGDVDVSTGVLRGNRHSDGGVKMYYEAESGEFATSDGRRLNIVNRKMTAKHFDLLTAINKDDRFAMAKSLADLTGGMQLNIDRNIPENKIIVDNNLSIGELREIRNLLKSSNTILNSLKPNRVQITDNGNIRIERIGNSTRIIRK